MQGTSDDPLDTHHAMFESGHGIGTPRTLMCLACAEPFDAPINKPRLRCPSCSAIGYPDKAGRNMVTVGWECFRCRAWNTGRTNFCMECSAGLTSRCLKCEAPVYTSVCHQCSSHQDALRRLRSIEADRASWVPLQRSRLEEQQRNEAARQVKQASKTRRVIEQAPPLLNQQAVTGSPAKDWLTIDQQMRQAARQRSQRAAGQWRRVFRPKRIAMVWLIAALAGFLWYFQNFIPIWSDAAAKSDFGTTLLVLAAQWWVIAQAVSSGGIDMGSMEYTLFFAVTLFVIAAAPALIYALGRGIKDLLR